MNTCLIFYQPFYPNNGIMCFSVLGSFDEIWNWIYFLHKFDIKFEKIARSGPTYLLIVKNSVTQLHHLFLKNCVWIVPKSLLKNKNSSGQLIVKKLDLQNLKSFWGQKPKGPKQNSQCPLCQRKENKLW